MAAFAGENPLDKTRQERQAVDPPGAVHLWNRSLRAQSQGHDPRPREHLCGRCSPNRLQVQEGQCRKRLQRDGLRKRTYLDNHR